MTRGCPARAPSAFALVALSLAGGCAEARRPVADAFPVGVMAAPWRLQDQVWTGTFEEAAPALGADADAWRAYQPTQVWLAIYCHEERPHRCLTVRGFAFPSADRAREAYESLCPAAAPAFNVADRGCWSDVGIVFQWGRLVFDIFGQDATWNSQVQSALLANYIIKRMPRGAADNPQ